ncbi:MAG TPA: hypothetical protein VM580_27725 [Labilithrix sp.]|nr:hypothetical protein [Labilithrix sp.]
MTTDEADALAVAHAVGSASVAAAGLAVVLSPIPLADEVVLPPVYAWLTVRVARARGRRVRDLPWRPLAKLAFVGLGVRAALNAPLAGVPGVAAGMNAATAVALTYVYGACVDYVCRVPTTTELGLESIFIALRSRWRSGDARATDFAPRNRCAL